MPPSVCLALHGVNPSFLKNSNIKWIFLWKVWSRAKKRWNHVKHLAWNSIRRKLLKKASLPNPVNNLEYISLSSARPIKTSSNVISYNCQKICSWSIRPDLKPYWKSEKRSHFSGWSTFLLFTSFSKALLTTERRLSEQKNFAVDLSLTFLKTGSTNETFQQSGKQDSCRHLLKSSAIMYKDSGSQFFRTITGIQSVSDAFNESRFVMTFRIIVGVAEILCLLITAGRESR